MATQDSQLSQLTDALQPPSSLDKRLLHIIRSISPIGGGPAMGIRKLAEASAEAHGGKPWMELVCLDDPAEDYVQAQGFPVHALGPSRGYYGYTPRLEQWLKQNLSRFDGAVIHGLWLYHSYGAYRVLRGRSPYAIFPHGMLDPYFKRAFPWKHLRKQAYWLAREYRVVRDAKAVCFTTPIERDCSAGTMWPYRATPAVVSFGTSAPTGDPESQRQLFLEQFPQLTGRRFFLLLSRIHAKKGCDLVIAAFARVAAAHPDLDLVIAGPDESGLWPKLAAQARALGLGPRLHSTGMLMGDLKWGAIHAAAAFVLPSHQENFCVAAVEALAARLPVLISNKINIWPDIAEDEAGLVDDDTEEGTLRLMVRFLEMTREDLRRMTENGVRCFHSRYEMTKTAQALNDLF